MRIKSARLTIEELHQIKWLVGSFLCLLALWSLWSLDMQSELFLLIGGFVTLIAFFKPALVARIPKAVWRPAGFSLLLIVGADFVLHLPEFMPPLLRMVIMLLLYRALAPRRQRDDLQVVLLCLFCLVISGVLTVSLLFGFQILLFTPVAMSMLFLISLLDRGPESRAYQIDWSRFSLARLVRRALRVMDYRVLFLGSILFGFVVMVSTLLFVLTPRFDIDQAIPYLQIKTETRAGFSENVKLGSVSEIQADRSVALRVDVPSLDAIEGVPYWRILTLDKYDNGYFRMSEGLKGRPYRSYPKERELMGRKLVENNIRLDRKSSDKWTLYLEGGTSQFLPVPGLFHSMRFEGVQELNIIPGLHHVGLNAVRQRVFSYQIEDMRWTHRFPAMQLEVETFARLQESPESSNRLMYPRTTLELNVSDDERAYLTSVNDNILADAPVDNAAEYSARATGYLWDNYSYSLSPDLNGGGKDAIVRWLRNAKAGHCEYFAGSFILLAREAGYPARMAVGFSGGAWNMVEEYFVVRNDDAHAWVEIYDASSQEWLRVDPTPGSGSSDPDSPVPSSQKFEVGWDAWIDSLRIQWYRRVVNFDQSDQLDMAITVKDVWDDFSDSFSDKVKALGERFTQWLKQPLSGEGLIKVVILASTLLAFWGIWHARYYCIGLVYRLLRRPKKLDPVRMQASRYLKKINSKGIVNTVAAELQALRFGPPTTRSDAKVVFNRARDALRAHSKSK